jgi:hypothetical protein
LTLSERRALAPLLALALLCFLSGPVTRLAADPIGPNVTVEMLDAEGHPESRAGAHPDLLRIDFSLAEEGGSVRDLEIDLPPGLAGNPHAVPQCPRSVYESETECPPESQVGRIEILVLGSTVDLPLFQVEPLPGEVLALGSRPSLSLPLTAAIRPDDFGVTLVGHELPPGAISSGAFELWGVPADHQEGTSIPRRPFLTAPTECGPVVFQFRMRTWAEGAQPISASADTGASLAGCEGLSFKPGMSFAMSEPAADSPTGLSLALDFPAEDEASERAPAAARSATIRLPKGVTISPGGADGLLACTDAQFGLGRDAPVNCPAASKIGNAEFVSDALGERLTGTIYMGEEHPGEQTRSLLAIPGPGFTLKLVSRLRVDPATGRMTTVMEGLPQAPIQRIGFDFDGGPGALFATPLDCGRATAAATVTPYGGGPSVDTTASVTVAAAAPGASCASPAFSPQLVVTDLNRRAGAPTAISTLIRRRPGEQLLRAVSSALPAGVGARLGSVTPCPSAMASAGSCPPESRIGSATATIGSGSSPAAIAGEVYFTGPYRGAPFAILTRFDGRIGPLNLGAIASRSPLEVNRRNGRMTVLTSDLPEQVNGVQVRFQSIALRLDRQGFLRNPTSCSPGDATATFESQGGAIASARSPLRLRGCHRLGFRPRVRLALASGGGPRVSRTPILRVTSKLPRGDSNMRAMRLVLPSELKLGTGRLRELCSRLDASRGTCPPGSRVGWVLARTPLLDQPMRGGVYMAQPKGDGLPDMWFALSGAGMRIDMKSRAVRTDSGRYVSALGGLPDMPMLEFTMRLGGDAGVVSLRRSACAEGRPSLSAQVELTAQDGRRRSFRAPIAVGDVCQGRQS